MTPRGTWHGAFLGSIIALFSIAYSYFLTVPISYERQHLNPFEASLVSQRPLLDWRMLEDFGPEERNCLFWNFRNGQAGQRRSELSRVGDDRFLRFRRVGRRSPAYTGNVDGLAVSFAPLGRDSAANIYLVNPIYFADGLTMNRPLTNTALYLMQ